MTRKLKYTCTPACHNTLIDLPEYGKWDHYITCPVCGRKAFFMAMIVLSVPTPEPEIDTDPTAVNRPPWYRDTKAGDA